MKSYIFLFTLVVLTLALTACPSKKDDGGPQPPPNPNVNPANNNPQPPQNNGCGPNQIPFVQVPGNPNQNPNNVDVLRGLVLNRQFHVLVGSGIESYTNSCAIDTNSTDGARQHKIGFLRGRDDLVLNFDGQGVLTVYFRNFGGEAHSIGPVPYNLDYNKGLNIAPFQLIGAPNDQYISYVMSRANQQSYGAYYGGAGGGYDPNFQGGQPPSPYQFGNFGPGGGPGQIPNPQMAACGAPNNQYNIRFEQGIRASLQVTSGYAQQHIWGVRILDVAYLTEATVSSNVNTCMIEGTVSLNKIYLQ